MSSPGLTQAVGTFQLQALGGPHTMVCSQDIIQELELHPGTEVLVSLRLVGPTPRTSLLLSDYCVPIHGQLYIYP